MHSRSSSKEEDGEIPIRDLTWDETDESSRLGEGSFGRVVKGSMHGEEVAIKIVKRYSNHDDRKGAGDRRLKGAVRQHEREWHRLSELKFATIVQFFGVARRGGERIGGDLMIVTEFMRGGSLNESLVELRRRGIRLREESFLRIAWQVSNGLRYVHSRDLTHGDIKPHNILMTNPVEIRDGEGWFEDGNWKAKLADFGLSMRLRRNVDDTSDTADFGQGAVGTFLYMAPEAYENYQGLNAEDAKAVDVYALGIVLQEMLTGRQPWVSENVKQRFALYERVVKRQQRPIWGDAIDNIRPEYVSIVKQCLAHNPQHRPTAVTLSSFFQRRFTDTQNKSKGPLPPRSATSSDAHNEIPVSVVEGDEELAVIQHVESRVYVGPAPGGANNIGKSPPPWINKHALSTHTGTEIDSSAMSVAETSHTSNHSSGDASSVRSQLEDRTENGGFVDSIAGNLCIKRIETGLNMDRPATPGLSLPGMSFNPEAAPFKPFSRTPEIKPNNVKVETKVTEHHQVYIPGYKRRKGELGGDTALGASTAFGMENLTMDADTKAREQDDGTPDSLKVTSDPKAPEMGLDVGARKETAGLDSFIMAANGGTPEMALEVGAPKVNAGLDSFIMAANGGAPQMATEAPKVPAMDLDIAEASPRRSQDEILASFAFAMNTPEKNNDTSAKGDENKGEEEIFHAPSESTTASSKGAVKDGKNPQQSTSSRVSPGSIRDRISMFENIHRDFSSEDVTGARKTTRPEETPSNISKATGSGQIAHPFSKQSSGDTLVLPKEIVLSESKPPLSAPRPERQDSPQSSQPKGAEKKELNRTKGHRRNGSTSPVTVSATSAIPPNAESAMAFDDARTAKKTNMSPAQIAEKRPQSIGNEDGSLQPKLIIKRSRIYRAGPQETWMTNEFDRAMRSFEEADLSKVTTASSDKGPSHDPCMNTISLSVPPTRLSPSPENSTPKPQPSSNTSQTTPSVTPLYPKHSKSRSPSPAPIPSKVGKSRVEVCIANLKAADTGVGRLDVVRKELSLLPSLMEVESSFTDPAIPPCDCSDTIRGRRSKLIESLGEVAGPGIELLLKQRSVRDIQKAMMCVRALLEIGASHGIGPSLAIRMYRQGTWNTLLASIERHDISKAPLEILSCVLAMTGQLVACGKAQLSPVYDFARILAFLGAILDTCLWRFFYNPTQNSWMASAHCAVAIMTVIGERATSESECMRMRASSTDVAKRYSAHVNVYGHEITSIVHRLRSAEWKGYDRMRPTIGHERRPSAP